MLWRLSPPCRFVSRAAAILAVGLPLSWLGCGSSSGNVGDAGTVCTSPKTRGCVDLLNFNALDVTIHVGTTPVLDVPVPSGNPGLRTIDGVPSAVGNATTFTALVGGIQRGSVTCTVTADGWVDVRPSVVWQPSAFLTCTDF